MKYTDEELKEMPLRACINCGDTSGQSISNYHDMGVFECSACGYDDQDDIDDLISRYQINEGQCMYCNSSLNANVDDNYDISHENIKCPNCNKWQPA